MRPLKPKGQVDSRQLSLTSFCLKRSEGPSTHGQAVLPATPQGRAGRSRRRQPRHVPQSQKRLGITRFGPRHGKSTKTIVVYELSDLINGLIKQAACHTIALQILSRLVENGHVTCTWVRPLF